MESCSTSQAPGNANQDHNDTRICCATQGIQPAFHNNYKGSITFKRYESLCFDTCNLHFIIHQLYVNHKNHEIPVYIHYNDYSQKDKH